MSGRERFKETIDKVLAPRPCPECGERSEQAAGVLKGIVPAWRDDPTVRTRGWLAGRCGFCGRLRADSQETT